MTQLGSALVAVALALTAYFAIAAWQATTEERHAGQAQGASRAFTVSCKYLAQDLKTKCTYKLCLDLYTILALSTSSSVVT